MSTTVNLTDVLTADPEMRYSTKGQPIAKFTVVTSRRVKDQQTGEWADADTSFWDVVAFGQLAENVCESLAKGTAVLVSGRAAQRTWETKEGEKRRSIEVTAEEVAPSLRWASAKVTKVSRDRPASGTTRSSSSQGTADPWASDRSGGYSNESPF